MSNVLVFGHQNPDNDAIMSSVVLSQLLNQVEFDGNTYQACCLGRCPPSPPIQGFVSFRSLNETLFLFFFTRSGE